MTLDLLAIAAHPDDVELTCGGTLLKMAERGYKTGILDLTAGEMGTKLQLAKHLAFALVGRAQHTARGFVRRMLG